MIEENPPPDQIASLKQEVQDWSTGLRWAFVAIMAVPLLDLTWVLLKVPMSEAIFEDMLGSKDKLPELTKLVLKAPMVLLALLWGSTGLATFLIFNMQQARQVTLTAIVAIASLFVCIRVTNSALLEPLFLIVKNLSGGS